MVMGLEWAGHFGFFFLVSFGAVFGTSYSFTGAVG
jgi:hypothetical protein